MALPAACHEVRALTFDLFGTVLDLGGSLTPFIAEFLRGKGSTVSAANVWAEWRYRQRIEQYQDNICAMGHSGYLEVARRAGVYVLRSFGIEPSPAEMKKLMEAWQMLKAFDDVLPALEKMKSRFKLVALSNGERVFLDHLVKNRIHWPFDAVISVEEVGAFKPHPGVYRRGAADIGLEVGQCMMVSANSFDVMGARMCGMRGAFVNRYNLPYEDTPFVPDVTVKGFAELAAALLD
jgi:2-haloacid dehalogenase